MFQSTRPRGARLYERRDVVVGPVVSIHAPARGATTLGFIEEAKPAAFQSTRPRGARHFACLVSRARIRRFNPRARAGRDTSRMNSMS